MLIRGQCFTHKRLLDAKTMKPQRCVVSAFRHGWLYYKIRDVAPDGTVRHYTGGKFPEAEWPRYVMSQQEEQALPK